MKIKSTIYTIAFSSLFLVSCGNDNSTIVKTQNLTPVVVSVESPKLLSNNGFVLSGTIIPQQQVSLHPRMNGYVQNIYVKSGDKVQKGTLLATIENKDQLAKLSQLKASLKASQAQYNVAEKNYNRFQKLHEQNSVTDKEWDDVKAGYEMTKAKLEATKAQIQELNTIISYNKVVAPFSGIVTQKMIEKGDLISPMQAIFKIENNKQFKIKSQLPENLLATTSIGDKITLEIPSISKKFIAKIDEMDKSSGMGSRQYGFTAIIENPENISLFSDMYATVSLKNEGKKLEKSENTHGVFIPVSALVKKGQLTGVFTPSNQNTAILRWIQTGIQQGNQIEVVSGLNKEEKIIVKHEGRLKDGMPIQMN